ncbi:M23 family metallopeptidase [Paenibacillus antri]|uniref:M23 family metallopeptidase n=1 Tax=Paenibacillus antri TaxID=2582848 RepID=A0A5R9GJ75_9BACL|nr:peptidoglycan DD-metalloendopeptidase family protein [Paenibacillus antri]TLS53534.1 M23 family metallopeptidase [Paenibacillus antri]
MDDLRKRRQQRIQHILNGEDPGEGRRNSDWLEQLEHERRMQEDPEYAWHIRGNPWRTSSSRVDGTIKFQAVAAVVLFASVWAMFQWEHPVVAEGQAFVRAALTEEQRLDDVYAWYEDRFGELPSFVPAMDRQQAEAEHVGAGIGRAYIAPVTGSVVEPFGGIRSGAGVVVRASASSVASMDEGLVIYAGETQETGQTVVVRHPDGVETVYGYLGEIKVAKDDWVEAGDSIGAVRSSGAGEVGGLLYFAVKKGNSFVDPADVVAL